VSTKDKEATCQDDYDPNSLNASEAHKRISDILPVISDSETVKIRDALNRTLIKDILSTIDVPAYTNSAMDGFGVRGIDLKTTKEFTKVGVALAGKPFAGQVNANECVRIMTGAVIPDGVDTVIMQEHTSNQDSFIKIVGDHKIGQNVRQRGEDLSKGAAAVHAGRKLSASDIGLFASLGIANVEVVRKLRVAFLSTGDELKNVEETLEAGQIYDSNRYTIYCMLQNLGVEAIDLGIIPDDPNKIRDAFEEASEIADVIITSGGVSVGDADYVKLILEEIGQVNFWKIAMKPGRPLAVGTIRNAIFFGLPGNPVSAMVTFYQYIQPALRKMMGQSIVETPSVRMKCISSLKKRPGRIEYQRGRITLNKNGEKVVESTGNQGSHVLSSMSNANCFIVLPMESGNISENSYVEVQPFEGLI